MPFGLIDPDHPQRRPEAVDLAAANLERAGRHDLRTSAPVYQPSPELVEAINVAATLGAPLLLTGKPGTGKTQVAYYLKWYLRVDDDHFHVHPIRSTSVATELTYTVDEVRYFHAAHNRDHANIARRDFVEPGPLWRAYTSTKPSVVLIDEVDKAPRDFPNDLLFVLDQHCFRVPEYSDPDTGKMYWVERALGVAPPIIVITSNSERRLPAPFLRRCVFHHIELTPELLRRAVRAHLDRWPTLDETVIDAAVDRSLEMEGRRLRKPPSTAELILWLSVIDAMGGIEAGLDAKRLSHLALRDLPALSVLIKDADDFGRL